MRRTAALASTAVALTLMLGACGGDDSSAKSLANAIEEKTGGTDTTVKGGSSSAEPTTKDFSGKGSGDFCKFAKDVEDSSKNFDDGDLDKLDDLFDTVISAAPSEIKDDFKVLKKAIDTQLGAMKDPAKIAQDPEALQKAMAVFSSPEYVNAAANIDKYMEEVCGIDSDSDTTTK